MYLKKLFYLFLTYTLIAFIVSCKENQIENALEFEGEYTLGENGLDYEFILTNEPGIATVYVVDSLLFTIQSYEYPFAIKVFNKHTLKFLGEFGDRDGPDMLRTISYNGQFFINEDGIKIGISDYNRPIWWLVNISKSVENGKTVIEKKFELPKGDGLFFNSYLHPSNKFIGNTIHTSNRDVARLKFLNIQNDSSWIIPLTPVSELAENLNRGQKNRYYGSNLVMSPNGEHFASGLFLHNQIDFYNKKGELINTLKEDGELKLSEEKTFEEVLEEKRNYYGYSFAADDFFLITHWKGFSNKEQELTAAQNEIRAFNYKGKPLFKIHSPYRFESISLDLKNGILYGYVYDEQSVLKLNIYNQLLKFNLL